MFDRTHLSPIDDRIIVVLTKSKHGFLNTEEILKQTSIAASTWSAEQNKLVAVGLVTKRMVRVIEHDHISKRMTYGLTDKGKLVGLNLLNILEIMTTGEVEKDLSSRSLSHERSENGTFQSDICECVEIALDSFGSNLMYLVKKSFEIEYQVSWTDLPEKIIALEAVLKDYFGLRASEKLKKLIAANIRSRFDITGSKSEDLSYLISEARKTRPSKLGPSGTPVKGNVGLEENG